MNESEFIKKFTDEIPMYKAWGELILHTIENELQKRISPGQKIEMFLKIPSASRVKALDSLVNKAFYRGKNYTNPYDDITDKVGIRFVVLLEKDINTICSIVENIDIWTFSKDRNYLVERLDKPTVFDYQSVHYVVKAKNNVTNKGIDIPNGTACEIQVRTLLQHAYSELTHDTIYKSITEADPESQRIVAKSMALIETTDELFTRADEVIQNISSETKNLMSYLENIYNSNINKLENIDDKLNVYLYDNITSNIDQFDVEVFETYINDPEFSFVYGKINQRKDESSLFRQPVVILIYYLAREYHRKLKDAWPLTRRELEPFLIDTGHAD